MFTPNGVWAIITQTNYKDLISNMKHLKFKQIKDKNFMSQRFLVFILILILSFIPITSVAKIIEFSYKDSSIKTEVSRAKGQCSILATDIAQGTYLLDLSSEIISNQIEDIAYMYHARVMIINSNLTIVKDTYIFDEERTLVDRDVIRAFNGDTISNYNSKACTAKITVPIIGNDNLIIGAVRMDVVFDTMKQMMNHVDGIITSLLIGFGLLIMILAILFSVLVTRPAYKMNKEILRITEGEKESRLNRVFLKEFDMIGNSVNQLLDKLDTIETSRETFVSDVSHELKTPMTSIKVIADSLLASYDTPLEVYKDFMIDVADEIERENKIINDLLELVKSSHSGISLNIELVNINELTELVLKRLKPIARNKNVELTLESVRPVAAQVDRVKFTLVITNIVENAIKYNIENGYVRVSINADHKFFYVDVSDSGIGIPMECKDKIFDRFYRVDKARSRETGGTGLGLSITRNIVLLHKGTIRYYSKENEGTTFTIRVPLNYVNTKNN